MTPPWRKPLFKERFDKEPNPWLKLFVSAVASAAAVTALFSGPSSTEPPYVQDSSSSQPAQDSREFYSPINIDRMSEACESVRREGIEMANKNFPIEEIARANHPYEDNCGQMHDFRDVQEAVSRNEAGTSEDGQTDEDGPSAPQE